MGRQAKAVHLAALGEGATGGLHAVDTLGVRVALSWEIHLDGPPLAIDADIDALGQVFMGHDDPNDIFARHLSGDARSGQRRGRNGWKGSSRFIPARSARWPAALHSIVPPAATRERAARVARTVRMARLP
jgi:hypothetical protein